MTCPKCGATTDRRGGCRKCYRLEWQRKDRERRKRETAIELVYRICLRCQEPFESHSPFNRICAKCKAHNETQRAESRLMFA
jgi:hypothetical protein